MIEFSKCIFLCLCLCLCVFLVRSGLLITLIKCIKCHKAPGSLCSVNRRTYQGVRSPIRMLWTAKKKRNCVSRIEQCRTNPTCWSSWNLLGLLFSQRNTNIMSLGWFVSGREMANIKTAIKVVDSTIRKISNCVNTTVSNLFLYSYLDTYIFISFPLPGYLRMFYKLQGWKPKSGKLPIVWTGLFSI